MTSNAINLACIMIQGDRPSSYGATRDNLGRTIEAEFRQCSHCQASWIYQPGSGRERGFCYHCNGLLCGSKPCFEMVCAPYYDTAMEDYNRVQSLISKYTFDNETGVFIRR